MKHIGFFEESLKKLGVKSRDIVDIEFAGKPISLQFIRKKLDGEELNFEEIYQIVKDIVDDSLTTVETSYFVSACYTGGLSKDEIVSLTKAMVKTGVILKFEGDVFDKHCIGGIAGNRTTPIIVPICCAAGLKMPKTSSRSITSPAGTADTVEILAPVDIPLDKIKKIVKKTNGCMVWGGAINLAPADDKIIKIEHPLRIDSEGQLLASILAKKKSVSSTHVLIDIPIGKGAKIEDHRTAIHLKNSFEDIGKSLNMTIKVIITDGCQPIGNGIGPALEARDVLWVLEQDEKAPKDLKKKSLEMAGILLEMAGKAKEEQGYNLAKEILESGKALEKMNEIIKAQGGKPRKAKTISLCKHEYHLRAHSEGKITHLDNNVISRCARIAGSPQDRCAGIYLHKHVGDEVLKHQKIFTIYASTPQKLRYAIDSLKGEEAFRIG
jgi:putative thymidine phosphorylase